MSLRTSQANPTRGPKLFLSPRWSKCTRGARLAAVPVVGKQRNVARPVLRVERQPLVEAVELVIVAKTEVQRDAGGRLPLVLDVAVRHDVRGEGRQLHEVARGELTHRAGHRHERREVCRVERLIGCEGPGAERRPVVSDERRAPAHRRRISRCACPVVIDMSSRSSREICLV